MRHPSLRKRYTCRKSYQWWCHHKNSAEKSEKDPSSRQTEKPRGFWTPLTFFLELQLVKKQPQLPNLLLCFLPLCVSTAVLKFYSYTCRNFYELGIGAEMQLHCKLFDPSIRRPWNQWHGVWKSQKKYHSTFASEASYVYILIGQKLIKNAKNGPFWRGFKHLKLAVKQCY